MGPMNSAQNPLEKQKKGPCTFSKKKRKHQNADAESVSALPKWILRVLN